MAEERLRTIEMISRYREDKIKAEFRKLEEELKAQQKRNALDRARQQKKQTYYIKQKQRFQERTESVGNSPDLIQHVKSASSQHRVEASKQSSKVNGDQNSVNLDNKMAGEGFNDDDDQGSRKGDPMRAPFSFTNKSSPDGRKKGGARGFGFKARSKLEPIKPPIKVNKGIRQERGLRNE